MKNESKLSGVVLSGSLLAFIVFTLYIFYINQEVLYTAHDRSEFIFGEPFFHRLVSKPFGLIQYAGAWLTQFFYKPGVGTAMLLAIWTLIYYVGTKAFRLQPSASALLLLPCSEATAQIPHSLQLTLQVADLCSVHSSWQPIM